MRSLLVEIVKKEKKKNLKIVFKILTWLIAWGGCWVHFQKHQLLYGSHIPIVTALLGVWYEYCWIPYSEVLPPAGR